MDAEYHFDVGEILDSIDKADVISLFFPLIRRTLLVDLRTNETEGPLMQVVPMANTVDERFRSLRNMRPRFARPESITLIPWPKYTRSLAALGVLDRLASRFARSGFSDLVDRLPALIRELAQAERIEVANAITGTEYQTLWESPRT